MSEKIRKLKILCIKKFKVQDFPVGSIKAILSFPLFHRMSPFESTGFRKEAETLWRRWLEESLYTIRLISSPCSSCATLIYLGQMQWGEEGGKGMFREELFGSTCPFLVSKLIFRIYTKWMMFESLEKKSPTVNDSGCEFYFSLAKSIFQI